jgi:hypothetical protein
MVEEVDARATLARNEEPLLSALEERSTEESSMKTFERRPDETISQFATRICEEIVGDLEIPCLDKNCKFYQDAPGSVMHNIQDHPALEESLAEEQR